ncbi:MAG TPA: MFS transporter [Usitatibacter sp.]|jgi:predicted MFS family arabinose efflux permease|nr:MFS transporter [Usitatibacter sp.]
MPAAEKKSSNGFTPYQKFVVAALAFLQFAVILDFMIVAPLGALVMPALGMSPRQFGLIVSAYAFSAGASGLLVAGFADRYDRKKLLLFFYTGFVLGTLWCGLANSFHALLAARIVTGIFGGVIGSVVMAIATDLFEPHQRGRVMGVIQTSFAASQILGLPIGIYLANRWNWHAPFLMMVAIGIVAGLVVAWKLKPVAAHLEERQEHSPWMHLYHTVREPRHWSAFLTMMLLATGGFMLMPFGSAYIVNNLGVPITSLPTIYLVTGIFTIFIGPLVGRIADRTGKYPVFVAGSVLSIVMVLIYTHLPSVSLAVIIVVNVVLFMGIFSRMVPFQAMSVAVPEMTKRGAYNALGAAIQQVSGGIASVIAGHIVTTTPDGKLEHFPVVGYVVIAATLTTMFTTWKMKQGIERRAAAVRAVAV